MISEKLVVIDDDPKISQAIKLILHEYEVISFEEVQRALDFLRKHAVNMVFLDVFIKNINGFDVLREIKEWDENIAVVMMTGFGSKELFLEALRRRADDFIEKPFDVVELRNKTKTILK